MTCRYEFDPEAHEVTSVDRRWSCPHEQHPTSDYCPFHMAPDERAAAGISTAKLTESLIGKLKSDAESTRAFIGAHLPRLDLEYIDIESDDQHPVDLRHTTIPGGISVLHGRFEEQLDLRHSTVGGLVADNCTFENGVLCAGTRFTDAVGWLEATVTGDDTDFTGAVFTREAIFDEVEFANDVRFTNAAFNAEASFEATQFYGRSNETGDNTTFSGAAFNGDVSFLYADFEYVEFRDVSFDGDANFEKSTASGTVAFTGSTFAGAADFDEVTFAGDVLFDDTHFDQKASFRGVECRGGTALLVDDASFAGATFSDHVTFERGRFGYSNFTDAEFADDVVFKRSEFADDVLFEDVRFDGEADFDEVLFDGDAMFTNAVFAGTTTFRGAIFNGGTNHLEDDAVFRNATFGGAVDFSDVTCTSAEFTEVAFKQSADFTDAMFSDSLRLKAMSFGDDTYFNFTEATISEGRIIQPEDGWVRFDLTRSTVGDVELSAENPTDERELLDYARFCDTTFEEFSFSDHTDYLDRNDWNLHSFDDGTCPYEFAVEMTPDVVEKTYLRAKNSASAQSNVKAAGEFRVKRQQHARRKFFEIAADSDETLLTRGQNAFRGIENLFLGISCGYGLRLYRITTVFALFPLFAGLLFALGGSPFETGAGQIAASELATSGGLRTLGLNLYFSYITFLTVGYGNIGPIGPGARFVSAFLVYMNVILAGLFLYALIKRSEI
ncbi:uncharacterized protein Nmlp_2848 [Natronomonas moolapensis 8.8.11]|uniref:Potassium channel domain-containing protein n=1 Tax=Natronomonas moolapensis (strain DSM 18674 / CECT 7526 / JCM 14361 / 8.8.11) TaxID=268739 RepID=M1Y3B2_NATM8|nr:pentapeptide repeat-containing protein [Natronomonas moolapensis]CCQ36998.1 uncharacterized protein Nmlp_2848 [Natronomonas moolapensis 8.8.11]